MATIKEVAKKAGVSVGTASHVLNGKAVVSDELRTRVEKAMAALDYHPSHVARSLSTRRTHTLGMVIPDINNAFFTQIIRGIESAVIHSGFSLIVLNTDDHIEREIEALSVLRSRRVDGIFLVIAPGRNGGDHIKGAIKSGIPVVCLDRIPQNLAVDCVVVDNMSASQEAVRHLIGIGHRDIAMITGPLSLRNAHDRLRGYKAALNEARISPAPHFVAEGDFRRETGFKLCQKMFAPGRRTPSALFVSNTLMALGALEAFASLGIRCPEDVALVTFDGFVLPDVFHPTITTVIQPAHEIGVEGGRLMLKRLEGKMKKSPVQIELQAELCLKESTLESAPVPSGLEDPVQGPKSKSA